MNPSASLLSSLVIGLTVFLVPVTGVLAAIMPYLMPKRECFAVTVPASAQCDPDLRLLKRRYAAIMLGLTVFCTAACAMAATSTTDAVAVALGVSIAGLCVVSYGLMLRYRSKVQALKRDRGWQAEAAKSAAALDTDELPRPLSLRWDLLFVPWAVVCLAVCFAGYGNIPEQIPAQMGMEGQVTSYLDKSPLVACFPALVVVFVDGLLTVSHWMMLRAKRFTDPAAPAQSAWAYAMFLRAQTWLIVIGGILCGGIGLTLAFSFVGVFSIEQTALVCLVIVLIIAGAAIAVSVVYGQNGSRLIAQSQPSESTLLRDNDRYWKLGVFYVNREDPALFVPERFGIGWTMNWGRPAAWAITLALAAAVIAFVVLVLMLK